jgi:hypothetical protein
MPLRKWAAGLDFARLPLPRLGYTGTRLAGRVEAVGRSPAD